jgi:uncharacterized membrane protein
MQIQKDYTKEVIKKSAQRLFLNKGFYNSFSIVADVVAEKIYI